MKIFERNLRRCVLMHFETSDDGEGGEVITYTDGVEFEAAFVLESRHEYRSGNRKCVNLVYTVILPGLKNELNLTGVRQFRRIDDGRVFHIIREREAPPKSSVIQFSTITAETVFFEELPKEDEL